MELQHDGSRKNGIMVALLSATAQVMQYQLVNKTVDVAKYCNEEVF